MKRNDLIFVLAATVILVIAWIIFSIMQRLTTSTISETVNEQVIPINGTFDTKTMNTLSSRLAVTPIQILVAPTTAAAPTAVPTPTPVLVFIASVSATPTPLSTSSATPTPGGTK